MAHAIKKISIKKCPLCGSAALRNVCDKVFSLKSLGTEITHKYYACGKCSFVFTCDPLPPLALGKYYAGNTQERRGFSDPNEIVHMEQQLNFLESSAPVQNAAVLEIGANNGSFLKMCEKRGASRLWYLEMNKESLSLLGKMAFLSNFSGVQEDNKRGSLDLIILLHTLEHIVEPSRFIRKFSTYLKDGGVFFIEVPDFTFHDRDTDELIFEHVNFFTETTLRKLFMDKGFDIIHSQITIDRNYPVCTKYIVRMAAKKSSASPKDLSARVAMFRKRKNEKERAFKKIDQYVGSLRRSSILGIYTASWLTIECLKNTKLLRDRTVAIFDRDAKKQGNEIEGLRIYDPKKISEMGIDRLLVLNEGYEKEIREYLEKSGFPREKVVGWSDFS